ncbi:DNA-binding protein, partial [Aeromicrobium phragmitis]
ITKFLAGAWIAISAMVALFVMMRAIHRHYRRVAEELAIDDSDVTLPSRVHGIVLVSKVHKPTMRAIAYARAAQPSRLEAVTVELDAEETAEVLRQW